MPQICKTEYVSNFIFDRRHENELVMVNFPFSYPIYLLSSLCVELGLLMPLINLGK